ncbi:MAG: ABC transporter permease, partial [Fibrobacterales bacterium]|nr:ABC transporter permease [Fibrobacterales bacterium]
MRVLKFLLKRLGSIVVSIACVVAITFAMMRVVPSDYFTQLELRYGANTAGKQMLDLQRQEYREIFHLDDPLWKQVGRYFVRVMKWDFGPSYKEPGEAHKITELVNAKLPVTLTVACAGMGIALVFGIPLGIFAALRRNSWIDYTLTSVSMVGQVVPPYVLAVLLTLFFAVFVRNFQIGDSFPLEWLALP